MAKGNNSVTGRRSSSRNAKPYDANNSFVKKVATKVTDLIPQRSWISKWFNLSQDSEKPPPLKRLCIRMDVTHPPGTFSIQPGAKAPLNNVSPSKQQYSVHDEMSEDFSEPAMAGPSGMSHLISSTPSAQSDIRDITAERSELNSLVAATNNGTTNGMDDNSESSESTSGCSSLIPQTNRQEAPTNVSYNSPFSNRKRFNNEKLNFTAHAQSPRSLFLDSNRDSLSSRRPSFNASVMTNTPDRASPLSSPFYSGNTTFGGANAAGLYKRGRNLFNNSNEIQLKVPRRTSVEVKPSKTAGVDSSGMSQTAKKILEALEHFSSPITDAKKIPVKMTNNMSSLGKKRMRDDETSPPAKVGLRHLTRELTVPTVPEILKLRRRQKLQDTTVAARRIVSARSEPPPPQEYHLRTQTKEDSKHHGKLKGKATNLDQEETVEPVNLPSIPLPISSLPNFNFVPPVNAKTVDKSFADKNETFTFASPIKITNTTKNLKSINNFTFSSPISADKQLIDDTTDSSSPAKRICTKSGTTPSSRVPTVTQNFMWSGSSTAPRPKEKVKNGDNAVPAASNELKSGSVMDVLCSKSNKIAAEKSSETKAQSQSNKDSTNNKTNAVALGASKTNITKVTSLKSDAQQDSSTMWECPECLIKNDNSEAQCFACKTAKPSRKDNKACESSLAPKNIKESETKASDPFGSQFKLSSSQWECASCYVRNKEADTKCVACSGLKPGFKDKTKSTTTKLTNSELDGKSLEESWECPNCKLKNSACSTTCSSCKTSKSNLLKASPRKGKGFASETNTLVNQKTGTPMSSSLNNSTLVKTETMDNFKPNKDTWECPCCMVRNVTTVDSCPCCNTAKPNSGGATKTAPPLANGFGDQFKKPEGAWNCDACMLQNKPSDTECIACGGLKPGSKKSDNSATNATSNLQFNFGIPPGAGGFKFGIDKADQQKTDNVTPTNGFKFGESQPSSQPGQFTFGIQKDEKKKGETLKSGSSAPSTTTSGFGFQMNPKNSEKTDAKQSTETIDKKQTPPFSFGIPKTESGAVEKNKQPASTSSSTMLPPSFTFGVPKSEVKQPEVEKGKQGPLLGNTVAEVPKSSTEATASPAVTSTSTLPSVTQSSLKEAKPAGIFSFRVPSSTVGATGSTSSAVTSLPSTQSSFAFPEAKPMQAATVPTFGQLPATASTSSSTFTFCESKITDGISSSKTFGALSSSSSTNSMFSSLSNAQPLFGNSDAKATPTFGTPENKKPAFDANASKPSAFAMPETKVPTFGSTETKPSIFRAPDTKIPVFGSADNKTTPLFNPTPQAPTATPTPTFNAPTATPAPTFNAPSATPNLFGSSVTPVFGSNASSTFTADTSKPNIFASTTKQGETNAPSPNLFTFTGTAAQPVAPPGTGFNFSANTNPAGPNHKPMFTFGSTATAPQNNNVFGGTFNAPAPNNPGFTFNAPKPETPAFNQPTTSSIFGAPPPGAPDQQPASFSSAPPNAGFNFGSTAPAASSGGFNFGAVAPAAAPPAGYNFNPPPAAPTFDPNTPPSFNFTGGNTPTVFSGTPQAVAQRKIKKAFRRMR
ncbi:uncharacterized protein LOC143369614 isoform X3 [Andrena cerasifolii]|uniref:uncharacterized protein LOC143369614 isoform X3 n=1 Tax=Andrena cerasifolii TaxID=2819439 RepID=UPI004037A393